MKKGAIFEKGTMNLGDVISSVLSQPEAGAILSFSGVARRSSLHSEVPVVKVILETWEGESEKALTKICEEIQEKYDLIDIRVYHGVGEFELGEEMVFVVIASRHRKEAFQAMKETIERYKKEVFIWKKEVYSDGTSCWVSGHPPDKKQ